MQEFTFIVFFVLFFWGMYAQNKNEVKGFQRTIAELEKKLEKGD